MNYRTVNRIFKPKQQICILMPGLRQSSEKMEGYPYICVHICTCPKKYLPNPNPKKTIKGYLHEEIFDHS